ncbi:TPA: MHS family MFS transporter, partial [Salmonella enterica]|nr:MHS family MFS transporter [Salmonella enterica]
MSGTYNATIRRVVVSAWIGNSIEYYDFLLYGLASALVFGPLFFPGASPLTAT